MTDQPKKRKGQLTSLLRQGPRSTDSASTALTPPRKAAYPLSTAAAPDAITLPPEADMLTADLQDMARQYMTARRRTGEALLESARWLSMARDQAIHGEWLLFLQVTGTSPDTAEQLLHIHARTVAYPPLADSIRNGWLNQTAAALLAKPSTPQDAIDTVLAFADPPKVRDVQRVLRNQQTTTPASDAQIPIKSVFDEAATPHEDLIEPLTDAECAGITQLMTKVARYVAQPHTLGHHDQALLTELTALLNQLPPTTHDT
ncbi:MAG: hypothetical protein HC828_10555 [Blastochloris sp.]|nr:hypothetical protein [Blastochloris sp.]